MLWLLLVLLIVSFTNAQVKYGETKTGHLTFYGAGADSGGTCMYNNPKASLASNLPTVAIGNFGNAEKCGCCVQITPKGTGSGNSNFKNRAPFIAYVNNQCPECGEDNLDLAETDDGVWDITWTYVDCPATGNIELQLKSGSTVYWSEVGARNMKVALKTMEFFIDGNWVVLERKPYNYFLYGKQVTPPVDVRLTSITGEQKTTTLTASDYTSALEPKTKVTTCQFSGSGTKPSTTPTSTPTATPSKTPTTTPSKTPTTTPTATPSKTPTTTPSKTPTTTPTATPSKTPTTTPTATPSKTPPSSSGSVKCTYAHNDVWWVEFNAPSDKTGDGTITCAGDTKPRPCTLASWGTYQCAISGTQCNAPRKAAVGGVCCSLDATCSSSAVEESSSESQNNFTLPIGAIIGIVASIIVVLVVLVVIVARKLRSPVMEHV